ncbi:hypothetical protein [Streptomyces tsukubensis]|uniref:ATP-binding protein n=1 Tax=Streptomyces tsukubensis TaxID=83656 RepID=A0A1V4A416_9ACTN|nr:hypothetical protein [Streptomyces tsukubensis]OON74362.1 hypothetical protein B1H18_24995 [Streptomyces tsukubensis]QFR95401.1 hypothetical protein GBW32_23220 [Streptomyces tsukubensis]
MARQTARHRATRKPRTLLRAGLTLAAAGAALSAAGASAAQAAPAPAPAPVSGDTVAGSAALGGITTGLREAAVGGLNGAATGSLGTVKNLQLDPLAGTGSDPLDNAVGTQVADFKPLSTAAVTGPIAEGASLAQLPVVGDVVRLLPG